MLTRYRRVTVEGARLLVGPWWDARTRSWLPLYPDLIAHPRHTPAGRRVLLCLEDACTHAALDDSGYRDCGSCRHYRQLPGACSAPVATHPKAPRQHLWRPSAACRGTPASRGKTQLLDQRRPQRRKHHETLTP